VLFALDFLELLIQIFYQLTIIITHEIIITVFMEIDKVYFITLTTCED
jgi:hypothetical protein